MPVILLCLKPAENDFSLCSLLQKITIQNKNFRSLSRRQTRQETAGSFFMTVIHASPEGSAFLRRNTLSVFFLFLCAAASVPLHMSCNPLCIPRSRGCGSAEPKREERQEPQPGSNPPGSQTPLPAETRSIPLHGDIFLPFVFLYPPGFSLWFPQRPLLSL